MRKILLGALGEGSLSCVSDGVNGPRAIVSIIGVHLEQPKKNELDPKKEHRIDPYHQNQEPAR